MTEELFGRKYKLTVGRFFTTTFEALSETISTLITSGQYKDPFEVDQFVEVEDLQIKASIFYGKTASGSPSVDVIEVINPSEEFKSYVTTGARIYLEAGYEQDESLPSIYSGSVFAVEDDNKPTMSTLKIYVGSNISIMRDIRLVKSYDPESTPPPTYYTILSDILETMRGAGITIGSDLSIDALREPLDKIQMNTGYYAYGNAFSILDDILSKLNLNWHWYFVGETLYLEPKDYPAKFLDLFTLNESNLKAPVKVVKSGTKVRGGKGKVTGYEFTLFLDGRVRPNQVLDVEEGEYAGSYKIVSVKHVMDYEGKSWDTRVICKRETEDNA